MSRVTIKSDRWLRGASSMRQASSGRGTAIGCRRSSHSHPGNEPGSSRTKSAAQSDGERALLAALNRHGVRFMRVGGAQPSSLAGLGITGYTFWAMKTAISLPDDLFHAVDAKARA